MFSCELLVQNVEVNIMVGYKEYGFEQTVSSKREVLWGGKNHIVYILPRRFRKHYARDGEYVGHPYVRLYNPEVVEAIGVSAFLHGPGVTLLKKLIKAKKPIACSVEIACNTYADGKKRVSIDYTYIQTPPDLTVLIRVVPVSTFEDIGLVADEVVRLKDIDACLMVTKVQSHSAVI